ncbi:hypothetical protein J2W42_001119 [Rhizobium tibeticum]|nr:hypothetical protein [Rhizobium tibeticum]
MLFGDLWHRPDLSARERSLVTMSALIAIGQPEQLPFHANRAMDNGLTAGEASEVLSHIAFYAGWPRAMSAVPVLKQVFANRNEKPMTTSQSDIKITPAGSSATPGPEQYFTGKVEISGLYQTDAPARVGGATVSFSAGARPVRGRPRCPCRRRRTTAGRFGLEQEGAFVLVATGSVPPTSVTAASAAAMP